MYDHHPIVNNLKKSNFIFELTIYLDTTVENDSISKNN